MEIDVKKIYEDSKKKYKVGKSFTIDKSVSDNLNKYCKKNGFIPSNVVNEVLKQLLKEMVKSLNKNNK